MCASATTGIHVRMQHFALPPMLGSWGAAVLWRELGALTVEAAVNALASRARDPAHALVAAALAEPRELLGRACVALVAVGTARRP